jgi:dolichol kinase
MLFEVLMLLIFLSFLSRKIWIPLWSFFIRKFEREEWKKSFPGRGLVYFFAGAVTSLYLFPRNLALASILISTLGDSFSCILGMIYKKLLNKNHHKKLIFGNAGGFFAGLIGASFYIALPEAALASAVGLIAEYVEMDLNKSPLDDNLAVPLASGAAVMILRKFV